MLAPVVAVISVAQRRHADPATPGKRPPLVLLFVIGFLACAGARSAGLVPYEVVVDARLAQTALLTAAMFALGAGVDLAGLRRVGPRPFVLATVSTLLVAGTALIGIQLLG